MRKSMLSVFALVLLFAMVLTACGNNDNSSSSPSASSAAPSEKASESASASPSASASASEASKIDNSKEVKLVMYLLGEAPKGMPEVLTKLNEKLKKDINATIELNYIGWGDVASKYPLVLASGEDVDIVYAADWNYYVSEATKGAFYPITEDLLKTYMPKYFEKQDPAAYEAAKVNGQQYMLPTVTPDRKVNVAVLRKDIMDKAGITSISKFSDIEPYLAEIKKDYKDMIPLNLDSQYDLPTPFDNLVNEKFSYKAAPLDSGDPLSVGVFTDWEDPSGKTFNVWDEPAQSAFKYAAGIMKKWYDAGYVNKNPYSNKVRSKDNFCEGKSGVAFGNSNDIQATLAACKEKGIDTYIFAENGPQGHSPANGWLNNGLAIAANSKNPERALQAIDLIMRDESYVNLVYYGIEGKNYVFTADGKLSLPEGVTSDSNTYPPDAAGFWFVDKDYFKPNAAWTDNYVDLYNNMKSFLAPDTYVAFSFNSEKVRSEVANLKNVASQYFLPLTIGAVKDVDKSFDTLVSKMKAAGVEKVKTEVDAQASAYLASRK
ncbi:DUF3502 domain-containing protein [Cohnella sp. AR92]|uniref:DUF3502 domain-containing protein n=1 Tax=Cohnella sp. AR92 TaxID=648716 RepID=UPI000F8E3518|nr:DUF3502 domain-containing protein [Cohnella sp. AR92]RUS45865.1 DUF3502 domain-containing protein [Cohnella sp. AR92]